jgi:hypothetical protein
MMVVMIMVVVMVAIMIMVMMVVVVRDFLLAVDADGEMGRGDATAGDRLADEFDARDVKGVQFVECGLRVGLEFEKCGGEHVACGAH